MSLDPQIPTFIDKCMIIQSFMDLHLFGVICMFSVGNQCRTKAGSDPGIRKDIEDEKGSSSKEILMNQFNPPLNQFTSESIHIQYESIHF